MDKIIKFLIKKAKCLLKFWLSELLISIAINVIATLIASLIINLF